MELVSIAWEEFSIVCLYPHCCFTVIVSAKYLDSPVFMYRSPYYPAQ